ncbi:MAG TPA: sugar transferase [Kineosporiaceae bacterium]
MPWPPCYPAGKRCLDLGVALILLPPALVVLGVAALAALVVQGRPIFFCQQRVGRHGVPFRLVKLRTMVTDSSAVTDGRSYHERDRVTSYGRMVRRLRVDECPQLLHIVTGRMSLVGPRPLLPEHVAMVNGGGRRHDVRPGLACYAQLVLARTGYLDKRDQVRLDEEYVLRMSLRTDLAILVRTVAVACHRRKIP